MAEVVSVQAADQRPVLTVPEVAELLRKPRNWTYEAVARGEIPGVIRLGRSIRVSRAAIERWIGDA